MAHSSAELVIVDTGMSNIGSVVNMCRKLGAEPAVASDPEMVCRARRIILPGIGSFDHAVERIDKANLREAIVSRAAMGIPLLGICLGMQLLLDSSEEGPGLGLGLIPGTVERLPSETTKGRVRIPHMGWSSLEINNNHPVLTAGLTESSRFYFVHSFAAKPTQPNHVLATSWYGDNFTCVVGKDNVLGAQFHPEKSHRHGKAFLREFLQWT